MLLWQLTQGAHITAGMQRFPISGISSPHSTPASSILQSFPCTASAHLPLALVGCISPSESFAVYQSLKKCLTWYLVCSGDLILFP